MIRFAAIKLLRALVTVFLCVTICFFVLRLSGDPVELMFSDDVPETVKVEYRHQLGLDRPIYEQYGRFVLTIFSGRFGPSLIDNRDAMATVAERIPATLLLGSAVFALALLIGVPAGVTAALRRGEVADRLVMAGAVFGYAMPNFFFGLLLILLFSLQLRWLPSSGYGDLAHLVLPAITLGTAMAGKLARFVRTSVLEVVANPFVRAARGMRLPPSWVLFRHIFPNAAIPVITFLGFELGLVIGGAVVTESVFAWPGVGQLLTLSVARRDLPVVQAIVFLIAATMVTANLLVDLAYGWLDPRIRSAGDRR